jgi:hypothetical protein
MLELAFMLMKHPEMAQKLLQVVQRFLVPLEVWMIPKLNAINPDIQTSMQQSILKPIGIQLVKLKEDSEHALRS